MSSVTAVPIRPLKRGSLVRLWAGIAILLLAAFLLARLGAGRLHAVEVETVAAGHGAPITAMDGVLVEYRGTTDDGKVFDSTEGRGPAPFLVGETVPGFRDALMQMHEGGTYRVLVPGRLAYGEHPPKGSGIGLSMVYRTVQMHDGEIEVQSIPGGGTTVRLLLPQSERPAPDDQLR